MTNSAKQFSQKRKKEYYYKESKKHQIRARSYFKLEQINKKYEILKDGINIIDLGCAPGGWLEYLDRTLNQANIIGIDLLEVKNQKEFSKNIKIIEDDFNNIEEYINKENNEYFDLIISDMAPEFSGNSGLDKGRTHKLNLKTIEFAKKYLKKRGNLLFKSFEGEDLEFVRNQAKKIFKEVKEYKPKSSQKKSAEVFELCFFKKET